MILNKESLALAKELLAVDLHLMIVNDPQVRNFSATYCRLSDRRGQFEYNLRTLGRRWFELPPTDEGMLRLIIHEFGHQWSGDHLSSSYHEGLCRVGARLAKLLVNNPEFFAPFEPRAPVQA